MKGGDYMGTKAYERTDEGFRVAQQNVQGNEIDYGLCMEASTTIDCGVRACR